MKRTFSIYFLLIIFILGLHLVVFRIDFSPNAIKPVAVNTELVNSSEWGRIISNDINSKQIKILVDGKIEKTGIDDLYMNEDLQLMISADILTDIFSCAVNVYNSERIIVEKYNNRLIVTNNQKNMMLDNKSVMLETEIIKEGDRFFVPQDVVEKGLSYTYKWDVQNNTAIFSNEKNGEKIFPYTYDYRKKKKLPDIKNQSTFGTCWAFAALTALESSMAPEKIIDFSEDHMSINNNFSMTQDDGGEYTMAIAYLASWTGPVLEADDPYGDGYSPDNLEAVVHLQEAQVLEAKNYDSIKRAVFLYGGVQSSLYMQMHNSKGRSEFYSSKTGAYCYIGPDKPNHDVVIIGWDDTYPAENFNNVPDGDGAFICVNSWGKEFAEDGVFYVSYYDSNIGMHNVVYTRVDDIDNYDNIYQSDLCGWVGQIGYDREYAYFSNVYEANGDEVLKAVSFYATGINTEYEIFVVEDFVDTSSFSKRKAISSGSFSNSGYYTVDIDEEIKLEAGKKYAIVVYISTPNSKKPVAIEYCGDSSTENVIISDGEGYMSAQGDTWFRVENNKQCNLCLKMFTDNIIENE